MIIQQYNADIHRLFKSLVPIIVFGMIVLIAGQAYPQKQPELETALVARVKTGLLVYVARSPNLYKINAAMVQNNPINARYLRLPGLCTQSFYCG